MAALAALIIGLTGCRTIRLPFPVEPSPSPPPGILNLNSIVPSGYLSQPSFSADGRLLALFGGQTEASEILTLYVVDLASREVVHRGAEELWTSAALSPDGNQIAACGWLTSTESISLIDWLRRTDNYLGEGCWPAWSPDGERIAYVHYTTNEARPERHAQIRIYDLSSGTDTMILDRQTTTGFIAELRWSPTQDQLAFDATHDIDVEADTATNLDSRTAALYIIDTDGSNLHRLTDYGQDVVSPYFTMDGEYLIYVDRSAPLGSGGDYLKLVDLTGNCRQLEPPLPGIRAVSLSATGNSIALVTQHGLMVGDIAMVLEGDFGVAGSSCSGN